MEYNHCFRVKARLSSVVAFHQQPASLGAITPPPIRVALDRAPASLSGDSELAFTIRFGPLPIHWVVSIAEVSESGFTDRQLSGPFAEWVHRHTFVAVDQHTTDVMDKISLRLHPDPLWWLVGLGMRLGLPGLFAYRKWKTRRILE